MILDELLAIPADATNATVQGVEMKVISNERAEMLLNNDAEDEKTHECLLRCTSSTEIYACGLYTLVPHQIREQ